MGKNNLYTIKSTSNTSYAVTKFDEDFNIDGEVYHISEIGPTGSQMICTCPAGAKHICRHRTMLRLFQAEDRVDGGYFYHFDEKRWYKLNVDGEVVQV